MGFVSDTQELAMQMQPICREAGAEVLEVTLPEEEEEQQEQPDLVPNRHGKQAQVKAEPAEDARVKAEEAVGDLILQACRFL